ncbi:hypothetical protein RFI_39295 [Reticulomyxa filosa]|uniref:Uncharacterized protein n=1 Tax=Reticulomyxa filosa TaxID=46433 RepID=X6LA17_RETFI|nr:hypothetical protein RFI_39295 [Reticulomyxa filosa]|eukprot:ETN98215.1 hypothetical protein RFI_39295 [Reticulomyxa filosa]
MTEQNVIRKVLLIEQIEPSEKLNKRKKYQTNTKGMYEKYSKRISNKMLNNESPDIDPTKFLSNLQVCSFFVRCNFNFLKNGRATRNELIQSIKEYPNCQIIEENKEFKIDFCVQDKSQFHLKISLPKSFPRDPPQLVLQPVIDLPWIRKKNGTIIYKRFNKKWKADSAHLINLITEIKSKVEGFVEKNQSPKKV